MSKYRYGKWPGNPSGMEEDAKRCVKEVFPSGPGAGFVPRQCTRKRGYGPDGLYCL